MRSIQIDDEVFAHIRSHAIPYEDKVENDTLRRMFGIGDGSLPHDSKELVPGSNGDDVRNRKKAEKANLRLLSMRAGVNAIRDGQVLYLHDHRGMRIPDFEATVVARENALLRGGKKYSMSELAEIGLKFHGYSGNVSGPRHWHTEDGVSIREVWDRAHLSNGNHSN